MDLKERILLHPRNEFIEFDEAKHTYTYKPKGSKRGKRFKGVTSWMDEYLPPFNAVKVATQCSKNPRSEYYQMEVQAILDLWKSKTTAGTEGHKAIEESINDGLYPEDHTAMYVDEMYRLLDEAGLTPIVAEWVIYDEELGRASAIDILCGKEGKIVIVDAKFFEKGMEFSAYKGKTFNYPLDMIGASKYDKVSVQADIYREILERNYPDVPLSDERYVLLYTNEGAELMPLLDYSEEINNFFNFNLNLNK